MSMERPGDIGPSALNKVPDVVKPRLNSEGYAKPPFVEIVNKTFTEKEKDAFAIVSAATSIAALREAIDEFNNASTPKLASEYGVTLDVMEIVDQRIEIQEMEGFENGYVILNRNMQGVAKMEIPRTLS